MALRETLLAKLSREELIERALDWEQRLRETEEQLAQTQAQIAELRRQIFGPQAEKLSSEQQAHLGEWAHDLQQEAQKPPPLSQEVLEEERRDQRRSRAARRPVRRPVPAVVETETVTLEPVPALEEKLCPTAAARSSASAKKSAKRPTCFRPSSFVVARCARSTPAAVGKQE